MPAIRIYAVLILMHLVCSNDLFAADARTIMEKSYNIKRVDDEIATLSFHFSAPEQAEKQAVYMMVWKNMHGEDGYDNKAIFFTEQPMDRKGIAYLGWIRDKSSQKPDDEWIYLPELRTTRRITPRDHDHAGDEDEFSASLITHAHLEPRPPELDDHEIISEQLLDGEPHYLISSTPKHDQPMMHQGHHHSMPARRINWVDKNNYRLDRIQFFGTDSEPTLDMRIYWTELRGFPLWRKIVATKPGTKAKTLLEFSDIRINTKLKNRDFSKRFLEKGANRFFK